MNPRKSNPFLRISTKFLPISLGLAMAGMFAQSAQALTWDANNTGALQTDGAGAWTGANQWWDGSTNVTWTSGLDAVFGNGGAGGAVTLASPTTVGTVTFNTFTGTYTIGTTGQALTINTGITKNNGTGIVNLTSQITLGGNVVFTNNATGANTDLNLSALTGAFGITKAGAGKVALVANPSFSGTTTIEQGELSVGASNALGTSATAIVLGTAASITNNYSVLVLLSGTNTTARNVTVGASNTATTGTYTLGTGNASSSATWNGALTLNQSLIVYAANGGAGTYTQAGTITSGAAGTQTVTINTNKTTGIATTVSAVRCTCFLDQNFINC